MYHLKKIFLIISSIICLVSCDLSSKHMAEMELSGSATKYFLGNSLQMTYTENGGGMLGLGDKLSDEIRFIIFRIGVGSLLSLLLIYTLLNKNLDKYQKTAFTLVLSGGYGNLIDRIMHNGNVTDFMVIEFFSLRTGVFNFADLYVTTGVITLLIAGFFVKHSPKNYSTEI